MVCEDHHIRENDHQKKNHRSSYKIHLSYDETRFSMQLTYRPYNWVLLHLNHLNQRQHRVSRISDYMADSAFASRKPNLN